MWSVGFLPGFVSGFWSCMLVWVLSLLLVRPAGRGPR